ncbi:MAG: (2Fe-2S) ferredoxin domain-containing protein [Bacteroidales bacterium]|jgi:NADP-reducing hydrogenase subunit HndB|nr:(2Fe-2S) ferredoxin domain-containing protein [Bacteroidales bacterium]
MKKIKSPEELKNLKTEALERLYGKEKIRVRVHMGTSGLASGAREIYDFMRLELEKRSIDADVIGTGDMGYSFAEPTIEVKLPGEVPVVFGNVDKLKADSIIEKYIKNGEYVDGILPANYRSI